jgi:hypothetical protein
MEGFLVRRRLPCRFQLEHLEDRLTPSGQGLLGATAHFQSETLYVDWSSKVNITVLNFNPSFQTSQVFQIDFRVELPVFSVVAFQLQPSAFGPSTSTFGSPTTGAFGTGFDNDAVLSPLASMTASTGASSQASSLARQSSTTPSTPSPTRTPIVVAPPSNTIQNTPNPAVTTIQTSQVANNAVNFVAGSQLRIQAATPSGASASATPEALPVVTLPIDQGAPAVNPRAVTNPIATPTPKLTPLPQSGGGNTDKPEEQAKPPAVVPPPVEQQENQMLEELAGAGLAAAFVPDNPDDAASALALVGVSDAPSAYSELQLLLLGVIAASTIGVAHRRNKIKESERELLEAANWVPLRQ